MSVQNAKQAKDTKKELSPGWRWVTMGELSDPTKGSSRIGPFGSSLRKDELSESGIPVIGIENVLPNRFEHCFRRFISAAKYAELQDYTVKPSDVLVSTMGTIGRCAVVPDNIETAIIDSHLFRFRLNLSEADPTFICYAINGFDGLRNQLEKKSSGAIMAGLNTTILRECMIPLPPLSEQQRIATVLREQMAAVDKARAAAQARLEAVKALPAVFLRQVFPKSGESQPAGWRWVKLGEVCDIVRGSSPRPKGDPRYYGGNVPRLMVEDVTRDVMYVIPRIDFLTEVGATLSRSMMKGDVVIVVSGAPGLPAILNVDACIHDGFVGLRNLQIEKLTQEFLFYYLKRSRELTDKEATGAIFRNLTTYQVGKIMIPLPPLDEQRRIAAALREQMAAVDEARSAVEKELQTINALPAALLRRAFNGEL